MGKLEDWNHDQPDGVMVYYGKCFVEGCKERSANYRTFFPALVGPLVGGGYSSGEIDIMSCDTHHEDSRRVVLEESEKPREFTTEEEYWAQWNLSPKAKARYSMAFLRKDFYGKVKL